MNVRKNERKGGKRDLLNRVKVCCQINVEKALIIITTR